MLTTAFDKITIKMITNEAGLIRPTFYKHFQDKYEVLEWIFRTGVEENVNLLLHNGMEEEAILMLCRCLGRDRRFYRRALMMEPGPNSFEQILFRYLRSCFLSLTSLIQLGPAGRNPFLSQERLAEYYAGSLVQLLRQYLLSEEEHSAEEIAEAVRFHFSNSIYALLQREGKNKTREA